MNSSKTQLDEIQADLAAHGEIHLTVSDISGEVEARLGQTTFDLDAGLIKIDDGQTIHYISADDVVHWYKPLDVFHE